MATLYIENRTEFDENVWQTATNFSCKQYNEWRENAVKTLQSIYSKTESIIPAEHTYLLGDIINLLSAIKIESEARPVLVASLEDFDGNSSYDISKLSVEEQDKLLEDMYEDMEDDPTMECFWQHIAQVAKEHELQEKVDHQSKIIDYVRESIDKRDIRRAWANIEKWRCPLEHAAPTLYYEIERAVEDYCSDNDLDSTDFDFDIEEIFNKL